MSGPLRSPSHGTLKGGFAQPSSVEAGSASPSLRPSTPFRGRSDNSRRASKSSLSSPIHSAHTVTPSASTDTIYTAASTSSQRSRRRLSSIWRPKERSHTSSRESLAPDKDVPRPIWPDEDDEDRVRRTRELAHPWMPRFQPQLARAVSSLPVQPRLRLSCLGADSFVPPDLGSHEWYTEEKFDEPLEVMSGDGHLDGIDQRRSSIHGSGSLRRRSADLSAAGRNLENMLRRSSGRPDQSPMASNESVASTSTGIKSRGPYDVAASAADKTLPSLYQKPLMRTPSASGDLRDEMADHRTPLQCRHQLTSVGTQVREMEARGKQPRCPVQAAAPNSRRWSMAASPADPSEEATASYLPSWSRSSSLEVVPDSQSSCSSCGRSSAKASVLQCAEPSVALHRLCTRPHLTGRDDDGEDEDYAGRDEEDAERSNIAEDGKRQLADGENFTTKLGYSDIQQKQQQQQRLQRGCNVESSSWCLAVDVLGRQHTSADAAAGASFLSRSKIAPTDIGGQAVAAAAGDHTSGASPRLGNIPGAAHCGVPRLTIHCAGSMAGADASSCHLSFPPLSPKIPIELVQVVPSRLTTLPPPPRVPTLEEQRVPLRRPLGLRLDLSKLSNHQITLTRSTAPESASSPSSALEYTTSLVTSPTRSPSSHHCTPVKPSHSSDYHHRPRREIDSMMDHMPGVGGSSTASSSFERNERMTQAGYSGLGGGNGGKYGGSSSSSSARRPSASRHGPSSSNRHGSRPTPTSINPMGGGDPWGMMVVHAVPSDQRSPHHRPSQRPSTRSGPSQRPNGGDGARATRTRKSSARPATSAGVISGVGTFGSPVKLTPSMDTPVPGDASFLPTPTIRTSEKSSFKMRLKHFFDPRKKQPAIEFDEVIM